MKEIYKKALKGKILVSFDRDYIKNEILQHIYLINK